MTATIASCQAEVCLALSKKFAAETPQYRELQAIKKAEQSARDAQVAEAAEAVRSAQAAEAATILRAAAAVEAEAAATAANPDDLLRMELCCLRYNVEKVR